MARTREQLLAAIEAALDVQGETETAEFADLTDKELLALAADLAASMEDVGVSEGEPSRKSDRGPLFAHLSDEELLAQVEEVRAEVRRRRPPPAVKPAPEHVVSEPVAEPHPVNVDVTEPPPPLTPPEPLTARQLWQQGQLARMAEATKAEDERAERRAQRDHRRAQEDADLGVVRERTLEVPSDLNDR